MQDWGWDNGPSLVHGVGVRAWATARSDLECAGSGLGPGPEQEPDPVHEGAGAGPIYHVCGQARDWAGCDLAHGARVTGVI